MHEHVLVPSFSHFMEGVSSSEYVPPKKVPSFLVLQCFCAHFSFLVVRLDVNLCL